MSYLISWLTEGLGTSFIFRVILSISKRCFLRNISTVSQHPSAQILSLFNPYFLIMLTLRLLMSYIYMELLVKPEMLTSYIYGPTFGNAETVSFY